MEKFIPICKRCGDVIELQEDYETEKQDFFCENCCMPTYKRLSIYGICKAIIKPPPKKKGGRPYTFTLPY